MIGPTTDTDWERPQLDDERHDVTTPEDPNSQPADPFAAPAPGAVPPPPPPAYGGAPQYGSPPPYQGSAGGYGAPPPYQGGPGYGAAPIRNDYASWGKRVLAVLVDALLSLPFVIVAVIFFAIGHGIGTILGVLLYLGLVAFQIWNVIIRQGATGQTIGKSQLHIKVLGEADGQVIGAGLTFVRQLAHILDGICYVGYAWPLWDQKRQTFADKIMNTIVITL